MTERPLAVTHLSNHDDMPGASRAGYRLHRALSLLGVESRILAGYKHREDSSTAPIPRGDWVGSAIEWRAERALRRLGLADLYYPRFVSLARHPWIRGADVLQLHKLHGGHFSLHLMEEFGRERPVVWTLHDMWALTGYCYGALDCERWMTGCGCCPQVRNPRSIPIALEPPPWFDTTRLQWAAKRRIYGRSRFVVVAPSRWLASLARKSPLLEGHDVHMIPNAVDTDLFRPDVRGPTRRLAEMTDDDRVIFFVTGKGDDVFAAGLRLLARMTVQRIRVVVAGAGAVSWQQTSPFPVLALGLVAEAEMAAWFAAADVFVLPTLQDNAPQVVIESMACGTPVVASAIGGVPDLVRTAESGYLTAAGDANALAKTLSDLLDDRDLLLTLRARCRSIAVSEYSLQQQARSYRQLYQELKDRYAAEGTIP